MKFYSLDVFPKGSAETFVWREKGHNQGDAALCPACASAVSLLTWLPPYRVVLELRGTEFGDLAFAVGNDFLVSQRFRDLYYAHGLKGLLGFDLVEVVGIKPRKKRKQQPPAYFRVNVIYGQAALNLEASGFEWLRPPVCPICRTGNIIRWKRLILEESTWTGVDVFRPRGLSGEIMVSQRFKDVCEQNGITNAVFTPAEESGHDFYPGLKDPSELDQFRTPKPSE